MGERRNALSLIAPYALGLTLNAAFNALRAHLLRGFAEEGEDRAIRLNRWDGL